MKRNEAARKAERAVKLESFGFSALEAQWLQTLHWTKTLHMSAGDGNTLVHQVVELGVERATFTPKKEDHYMSEFGTPVTKYYVTGEETSFATFADALKAVRANHYERVVKAMKAGGFNPAPA